MTTKICTYDIGCMPSPSSDGTLIDYGERKVYLIFGANSKLLNQETGCYDYLGVAVLSCRDCKVSKFGYPNEDGLPEHPLYKHGIETILFGDYKNYSSVLEVINSPWSIEVMEQMNTSGRRIHNLRPNDTHWGWKVDFIGNNRAESVE